MRATKDTIFAICGDAISDAFAEISRSHAVKKAARLAALTFANDHDLLQGYTLQQLADLLGVGHQSTIHRDLRQLEDVIQLRDELIES